MNKILHKFTASSTRSKEAIKNIIVSIAMKGLAIPISLILVPMTINYVSPTQYGIWLTLSSIIAWVHFFDLGLANGFRNKFAEAQAVGDIILARKYVSTTYFAISSIVIVLYIAILLINSHIDWTIFLNVESLYREELHRVFSIVGGFFCLNMVANIFTSLLTADQKPGIASILNVLGSALSLLVIWLLTLWTEGSLVNLAIYYSGVPCVVLLVASVIMFRFTKYRLYRPRIKYVHFPIIKNILNLGFSFFLISICLILVFQLINIVISREVGPEAVTQYNVAYKYFNVLYMLFHIVLTPFWSAFTDAYTKQDILWMRSAQRKLEYCWCGICTCALVMLFISPWMYDMWLHGSVEIPWDISVVVMLFMLAQSIGAVYMYMINGIGKVHLQLIIYIVSAVISWPIMILSTRYIGCAGALILPIVVYLMQAVFGKIQIGKLLRGTANGVWNK